MAENISGKRGGHTGTYLAMSAEEVIGAESWEISGNTLTCKSVKGEQRDQRRVCESSGWSEKHDTLRKSSHVCYSIVWLGEWLDLSLNR